LEFYVCDIHLYPFYRIRRVTKLQTPYFENSIGEVITLIQVLITMRKMIEKSIEIIKSFLIGLKDIIIIDNDEYGDDENDVDDDNYDDDDDNDNDNDNDDEVKVEEKNPFIQTQNSPKKIKKRKINLT